VNLVSLRKRCTITIKGLVSLGFIRGREAKGLIYGAKDVFPCSLIVHTFYEESHNRRPLND